MGNVDEAFAAQMAETQAKAKKAVKYTLRDEADKANAELEAIDWGDPQQAVWAMCTWADITATAYRKVHGLAEYDGVRGINLGFVDASTGEFGSASDVPAEWAWAGQFVVARVAGDNDTIQGLMWAASDLGRVHGPDAQVDRINAMFAMAVMQMRVYVGAPPL